MKLAQLGMRFVLACRSRLRGVHKTRRSFAMGVLSALALLLQGACSKKAGAPRQAEPGIFEELAGRLLRDSAIAQCGYVAFVAIRRPPMDRSIISHGCVTA